MPTDTLTQAELSRAMTAIARRRTLEQRTAGGRPRSNAKRCPCGVMTLKRAQARGRTAEHEPGCSFASAK